MAASESYKQETDKHIYSNKQFVDSRHNTEMH